MWQVQTLTVAVCFRLEVEAITHNAPSLSERGLDQSKTGVFLERRVKREWVEPKIFWQSNITMTAIHTQTRLMLIPDLDSVLQF